MTRAKYVKLSALVIAAVFSLWLLLAGLQNAAAAPGPVDTIWLDGTSNPFMPVDVAVNSETGLAYVVNQGVGDVVIASDTELVQAIDPSGDDWPSRASLAELHVCPSGCAYSSMQAAVDAANDGDIIKVATGTYTDVHAREGVTQVIYLSKTVTIRGGYTTAFTDPPDPEANPTTLDAQGQGRVLYITGDISPIIEGLHITGGDASFGGGLYIAHAAVTLRNNRVFGNTANYGGGLYLSYSDATLSGNTIISNSANSAGGGLYLFFSDATLINNIIADNQANSAGSGLYIIASSTHLRYTTIAHNTGGDGSGVYITDIGWMVGVIPNTVVMVNTILVSHTVGIVVAQDGVVSLKGTLWGNGVWANETDWGGAGNIMTGTVNVWGDPAFVNPNGGNYHIDAGSAAIDAGVAGGVITDLDGDPRPAAFGFDIGADERPGPSLHLHKAVWPLILKPDQIVTYTLSVTNAGIYTVNNIWLTDTLPTFQQAVAITVSRGGCTMGADWGSVSICNLGAMNPGDSAHITFTAQVTTTVPVQLPWQMRNTVWVTATETANTTYADTILQDCHVRLNDSLAEYDTIQAAVDASTQSADVVKIAGGCAGTTSRAGITQMVYISKTLTIRGGYNTDFSQWNPNTYSTTLDALGQGRVLYITGDVSPTVEGLHITGGDANKLNGGGVYVVTATASISNNHILSNIANNGGGLFLYSSDAVLSGNIVIGNTAYEHGGGMCLVGSDATLNGNTIARNIADESGGGGLYLGGSDATLSGNTITDNTAGGSGGGLCLSNSDDTLISNTIASNTADTGGGLALVFSRATLSGNTVADNTAEWGGGLWLSLSNSTLSENIISSNTATLYGGGLVLYDSRTSLKGNTVTNNVAHQIGGGIYLSGYYGTSRDTLTGNNIASNVAQEEGGGLYMNSSNAVLSENTVTGNIAGSDGGGLYLGGGDVMLSGNTVTGNIADGDGGGLCLRSNDAVLDRNIVADNKAQHGGGLLVVGDSTLNGNVVISNTASGNGGGLYLTSVGATLINTIVADNQASGAGNGLYVDNASPTLLHTTIARNAGSGVYVAGGSTVFLTNTILVNHTVGITVADSSTATMEATLWGSGTWANTDDWGSAGTIVTGSINLWGNPVFVDPDMGNYHLGLNSAALDEGVDAGVDIDMDGDLRPQGNGYEIGADETGLAVTKQIDLPNPVWAGTQLVYTIRVTNTSNVLLTLTATITDILPAQVTPTGILTWTPIITAPRGTWTEQVTVTVQVGYSGILTNVVQVATEEGVTGAYAHTATVIDARLLDIDPTTIPNDITTTVYITCTSITPVPIVYIGREVITDVVVVDGDTIAAQVSPGLAPLTYGALLYDNVEHDDTVLWRADMPWKRTTGSAHSVTHSWEAAFTDAISASLTLSGTLDLTGLPDPMLDFWHQLTLETGDVAVVEVSTEPSVWLPLYTFDVDQSLWGHYQLDLRPFASHGAVCIRFRVYNKDAGGSGVRWLLDDITITSAAGGVAMVNPGEWEHTDMWRGNLVVTNQAAQFDVELSRDEQVAKVPFTITLIARDSFGYADQDYTGSVTLSVSMGSISPTLVSGFVAGKLATSVQIDTVHAGLVITAADGTAQGTSAQFDVVDRERAAYIHLLEELERHNRFWVYRDGGDPLNHYGISYMGVYTDVQMDAFYTLTVHSGATAIRVTYTASETTGLRWGGAAWLDPGDNWDGSGGGFYLQGATELVFWARGKLGGERVKFGMGGVPEGAPTRHIMVTLSNQWERYTIPLNGLNLDRVVEGFFWAANCDDNPAGLTFFLDDIHYLYRSNNLIYVYKDQFLPDNSHVPSGWMGDLDQIHIDEGVPGIAYPGDTVTRFTYDSVDGTFGWAGVYYLWPGDNWGTNPTGGRNLSGAIKLAFRVRGAHGGERVTLGMGNVTGAYGDSTGKHELYAIALGSDWQEYTIDLTGADLSRIVGGFYWSANYDWNSGGLTFYLDDIRYVFEDSSWPHFIPSYIADLGQPDDMYFANSAHVYDNALAILSFLARGTEADLLHARDIADAFVYAQNHDPGFTDGRLRNAYHAEMLGGSGGTTWYWNGPDANDDGEADGDAYGAGSHVGNMSWAALALARMYQTTGDAKYLDAAISLGNWIHTHTYDDRFYGGYSGGYDGWEPAQTRNDWRSTEHNIDAYVAFAALYDITGETQWWQRALHAKRFVRAMWLETTLEDGTPAGWFWTGTWGDFLVYADGEEVITVTNSCLATPIVAMPYNHYYPTPFGPAAESIQLDTYYTVTVHSGESSIRLAYPASAPDWGGLIALEGDRNWGTDGPGHYMVGARSLTVWMKGAAGGETAVIGIGGVPYTTTTLPISTTLPGTYANALTQTVTLSADWQPYTITIPFTHTLDMEHQIGGFFAYLNPTNNPAGAEIFLDDIVYHFDDAGGEMLNYHVLVADVNSWSLMALGEQARYGKTVDWIHAAFLVTETVGSHVVSGFDFDIDKDGIWFEGACQALLAFQITERQVWNTSILSDTAFVQEQAPRANRKGIVAALHDCLTTNLGWFYYNRLHVAPTTWYIFAEREHNPYWGISTSAEIPHQGPVIQSVTYHPGHLLFHGHNFDAPTVTLQSLHTEPVYLNVSASTSTALTATLPAPLSTGVTYTLSLTNPDTQSDHVLFVIAPALQVTKWAVPDPVQAGERLTYTIFVTNMGNVELHASVTDTLPGQVVPGGVLAWTPVIVPTEVWTQTVVVTVAKGYSGILTNRVQVTSIEGATGTYTETSTAQVTPMLEVTKHAALDPIVAGSPLTYAIQVTNTGNVTLTATITDILPTHLTPTATSGEILVWTPIVIAPGDTWTQAVVVTVEMNYSGTLTNVVQVTTIEGASSAYTNTSTARYIFGDLDYDCDVDTADIMIVAVRWNARAGDPAYELTYDFDHDGDIDVADIMRVAAEWGNTCSGMMRTAREFDETGPVVQLIPSSTLFQAGEHVDISVEIQEADNLGSVQFDLVFSPVHFEFKGITLGAALKSTGNMAQVLPPIVDPVAGRVTCSGFSFGEHAGPGAGQLMVVSLVARQAGVSAVNLDGVQLVDMVGQVHYPARVETTPLIINTARLYLPLILKSR